MNLFVSEPNIPDIPDKNLYNYNLQNDLEEVNIQDLNLLPYEDTEKVSPLEKYRTIGKFPTLMVVHILLALLGALQVLVILNKVTDYSRQQERIFYKKLLNDEDQEGGDFKRDITLLNINQLKDFINESLENFDNLQEDNLEIIKYNNDKNILLEIDYIDLLDSNMIEHDNDKFYDDIDELIDEDKEENIEDKEKENKIVYMEEKEDIEIINNKSVISTDSVNCDTNKLPNSNYNTSNTTSFLNLIKKKNTVKLNNNKEKQYIFSISKNNLGPFQGKNNKVRHFLRDVSVFKIKYSLKTYIPYFYNLHFECFNWGVNQEFSFLHRNIIKVNLFINRTICDNFSSNLNFMERFYSQYLWIHILVIVLGALSLYLTSRYISKIAHVYMISKKKIQQLDDSFSNSEDSDYYNPMMSSSSESDDYDRFDALDNKEKKEIENNEENNNKKSNEEEDLSLVEDEESNIKNLHINTNTKGNVIRDSKKDLINLSNTHNIHEISEKDNENNSNTSRKNKSNRQSVNNLSRNKNNNSKNYEEDYTNTHKTNLNDDAKKINAYNSINNNNNDSDSNKLISKKRKHKEKNKKLQFQTSFNHLINNKQKTPHDIYKHLSMMRNYSQLDNNRNLSYNKHNNQNNFNNKSNSLDQDLMDRQHHLNLGWSTISILGAIVQILGAIISLSNNNNTRLHLYCDILIGLGCLFSYTNLGRYFEYSNEYDTIYATISDALPSVLRYLFGCMTLFLGFAMFAVCVFWRSEKYFNSPTSSFMTLFAIICGDSIFDVFTDIGGFTVIIGYIYTYVFCILFISIVLNVFIVILEDSYNIVKLRAQNHWLLGYMSKINDVNKRILEQKKEKKRLEHEYSDKIEDKFIEVSEN